MDQTSSQINIDNKQLQHRKKRRVGACSSDDDSNDGYNFHPFDKNVISRKRLHCRIVTGNS